MQQRLVPYSGEGPTVVALHTFVVEQGYQCRGGHHAICLGDPQRSAPAKLKRLLRQRAR
jgi:hypothetical protein